VNRRTLLLVVAIGLVVVPYTVHVVSHYIRSRETQSVLSSALTPRTYIPIQNGSVYNNDVKFAVTITGPRAMYTGMTGLVEVRMPDLTSENIDSIARSTQTDVDGVIHLYRDASCRLDAPGYTVERLDRCRFFVSSQTVGSTMLVVVVTNLVDFERSGREPRTRLLRRRGNEYLPLKSDDQYFPLNIAVDAPLASSLSTASTFLGIVAAVSALFFRRDGSENVDSTATGLLLKRIAKKRKGER
jgi:hypothetical protein